MKSDELIGKFIEKWLDFDLKIREKEGVDEDLYEDLVELLQEIQKELAGAPAIPKNLAEIFLDMWGAMTSCADRYDEDAKKRIYHAADRLTWLARNICTS